VEGKPQENGVNLSVLERVRCLECGTVYAKPSRGGTNRVNPGCPECGYVGWLAVDIPTRVPERHRSDVDRPLGRHANSG
jgi:predicted  nucleic acid-binding Zn-ribbon protein